MAAIIPVTINMQDEPNGPIRTLAIIGETLTDGLAITPGIEHDDSFHGGWTVTHLPSGRMVFPLSVCLNCLRDAAQLLTQAGVDWTQSMELLVSDPDVVRAVKDFAFAADACGGEGCGAPSDSIPMAA